MNKSKTFMSVSIAILITTIMVSGITYAWFSWSTTSEQETKIVTNMGTAKVSFNAGPSITGVNLIPTVNKEKGIVKDITIIASEDTAYKISFNLYLDVISIDSGLKHETFKYALYKEGETGAVAEGNFSQNFLNSKLEQCTTNSTNHIVLIRDEAITTTIQKYKLYIWIDGTVDNPDTMENQTFNFKLHADGQNAVLGTTLIDHITSLYASGNPTVGTNTNVSTYYQSYLDEGQTWGLMNDGYDGVTKVTDTTILTSGTKGNIRYYGANPNNYILFNCDDYSNQSSSTCELWRIIGIVDGKVKIIKNNSIGKLAWDQNKNNSNGTSTDTSYNNDWSNSSLQEFLNGKYYNRGTTTDFTYYSWAGGNTETFLNLADIGITAATREANLISESTWYLGGYNSTSVYVDDIYIYERTNNEGTTILNGNPFVLENKSIGLMYASDYGYGADLNNCSNDIYNYSSETCTRTNYLFNNVNQWLIVPHSSRDVYVWNAYYFGRVEYVSSADDFSEVHPVLYLNPKLFIESSYDGSLGNEYRIKVS